MIVTGRLIPIRLGPTDTGIMQRFGQEVKVHTVANVDTTLPFAVLWI